MAAPASPSRRALENKSTNASIPHRGQVKPNQKPTKLISMVSSTQSQTDSDLRTVGSENRIVPDNPKIGQKRSIEHVDGSEEHALFESTTVQLEPQRIPSRMEDDATQQTPQHSFSSGQASQESSFPVEEQFEIPFEASQTTLEKIHATLVVPQNTFPHHIQPINSIPKLVTESSQDSTRMSIFVDFDGGSAGEDETKTASPKPTLSPTSPARKAMIYQKAEVLRTRLQLAAYKIETNQVNTPFHWLHRRQTSHQVPGLGRNQKKEAAVRSASPDEPDAVIPEVPSINALPIPRLVPASTPAGFTMPSRIDNYRSSPPLSTASSHSERSGTARVVPGKDSPAALEVPVQLSSPPGSEAGDRNCDTSIATFFSSCSNSSQQPPPPPPHHRPADVTSSVLKGEAAHGLLELVRAAAES